MVVQDMAERVGAHMTEQGIKFVRGYVPTKFERLNGPDGRITVTATNEAGDLWNIIGWCLTNIICR